jgi:hypothetical protein
LTGGCAGASAQVSRGGITEGMRLTGHKHVWTTDADGENHKCSDCGWTVGEAEVIEVQDTEDVGYRQAMDLAALRAAKRRGAA